MKKYFFLMAASFILLATTSCATLFSKSAYPVSINSDPPTQISIKNENGTEVFSGRTPANVTLKASSGFFKGATYSVTFKKEGYHSKTYPIKASLDGWFWVNFLAGWIGFIIDPATGAMYKLDTQPLNVHLEKKGYSQTEGVLKIYTMNEIPDEWKKHLVAIEK